MPVAIHRTFAEAATVFPGLNGLVYWKGHRPVPPAISGGMPREIAQRARGGGRDR